EYGTSKALVSAKFTFTGLPAHASGSPERGRSALDGVELMNVGANYMREHVKQTNRLHYVITKAGEAPNVVPAPAQVWYYARADFTERGGPDFTGRKDAAAGAAKRRRPKSTHKTDPDCHEITPTRPLPRFIERNSRRVGPPVFDDADRKLALQLQEPLKTDF